MSDYVRAQRDDGTTYTTTALAAKSTGVKVLKGEPSVDRTGEPLPPVYPKTSAAPAAKKGNRPSN